MVNNQNVSYIFFCHEYDYEAQQINSFLPRQADPRLQMSHVDYPSEKTSSFVL